MEGEGGGEGNAAGTLSEAVGEGVVVATSEDEVVVGGIESPVDEGTDVVVGRGNASRGSEGDERDREEWGRIREGECIFGAREIVFFSMAECIRGGVGDARVVTTFAVE